MIEKYIELADRMKRGHGDDEVLEGIDYALRWLDEHPDQVPGQTITESEFEQIVTYEEARRASIGSKIRSALFTAGTIIVQDPEPTNAEKWKEFIRESNSALSEPDVEDMAAHMDQFGVKAPGGDDDQCVV